MGGSRITRKLGVVTAGAAAVVAVVAGAPAAGATSSHSISGTVYEGGKYYLSSTVRTVNGSYVQVQLNKRPTRGIKWRLYSPSKDSYFAGPVGISDNSTHTIGTNIISGTRFENSYAEGDNNCYWWDTCNYDFSGNEMY